LAERSGSGFNTVSVAYFRVTGGLATELAEAFEFIHGEVVTGEVEEAIEEHRAVATGEDEAVAVDPFRVGGVMLEVFEPKNGGDIGHAHRESRVAGFGSLDGIDRESADCIGG
jgi:hypothetical protein